MTEDAKQPNNAARRRDWILLPILAILTVAALLAGAEVSARIVFPEQKAVLASCFVLNDTVHGVRGKPDCHFVETWRESGTVSYQLDDQGYRNPAGLLAHAGNAFRIVMTGSSIAMAEHVPQDESAAAILPRLLEQHTGHPVVLYNEGMGFGFAENTDLRFQDVLDVAPNLILWVITPYDISGASLVNPDTNLVQWGNQSLLVKIRSRIQNFFANKSPQQAISDFLGRTRTAFALQFILYRSPSLYLKSYLDQVDSETGFLRQNLTPAWTVNLQETRRFSAEISHKAHAAGIPIVVTYIPNHAQAEMIAMGSWPKGYDPYRLNQIVQRMVVSQGDIFLNIAPQYRNIPIADLQKDYLPVDGHPNARGQALIARLTAQAMLENPSIRDQTQDVMKGEDGSHRLRTFSGGQP